MCSVHCKQRSTPRFEDGSLGASCIPSCSWIVVGRQISAQPFFLPSPLDPFACPCLVLSRHSADNDHDQRQAPGRHQGDRVVGSHLRRLRGAGVQRCHASGVLPRRRGAHFCSVDTGAGNGGAGWWSSGRRRRRCGRWCYTHGATDSQRSSG